MGVSQDDAQAKEWYTKAATRNHDMAQYNLGRLYQQGQEDNAKAKQYFYLACQQALQVARDAYQNME